MKDDERRCKTMQDDVSRLDAKFTCKSGCQSAYAVLASPIPPSEQLRRVHELVKRKYLA
jgi:hypothetical protein